MVLNSFVKSSVALSAMALALSGVAYGQEIKSTVPPVSQPGVTAPGTVEPGVADGAITRNGNLEADTATNAQTPPADAAASGQVGKTGNNLDVNAAAGVDGQNFNSQQNSNIDSGINVQSNGNQNLDSPSNNSGSDYSVNRPSYDTIGNNGTNSVMPYQQGFVGGVGQYGNGQGCCNAQMHVSQSYHHARRHRCGRHHNRHCCR